MARTERTLFAFQDKCFPLETIEQIYDDGMISSNDFIQIIEPRTTPYKITLKMLIEIYGAEHPFRMTPQRPASDDDGSSESSESPKPPEPSESPQMIMKSADENYIYQDYPLLHADDQPEDELITGEEVVSEMEKLKSMMLVKNALPKELLEYFYFTEGRPSRMGKRSRIIVCRSCSHVFGFAAITFFKHLFDEDHIKELALRKVSRSSFQFWYNHLEHYRKIAWYRTQHPDGYIPLLSGDPRKESREKLEKSEIQNLVDSFAKISESDFVNFKCYASQIFKVRKLMKYCPTCNYRMPTMVYQYARHIFSVQHLSRLRNVPDEDFEFWMEAFWIPRFEFVAEDESTAKKPLFDKIPLLQNLKSSPNHRKLSDSEIQTLSTLSAKLNCTSDNFYLSTFYEQMSLPRNCQVCNEDLPYQMSTGRVALPLTKHILSEEHLKKLKKVPPNHINFWMNLLYVSTGVRGVVRERKMSILSDRNPIPIPLLDFTLESEFMDPPLRLPRIDELYEVYKRIDQETLKNSKITLGKTGEELIAKNLKCFACNSPDGYFENNLELLAHMFTRLHVKYLVRFGFSNQAFLWWKKTLEDLLGPEKLSSVPELPTPSKIAKKLIDSDSESENDDDDVKKSDDKKPVIKGNGIRPNSSHIPLLDTPPEDVEMFESDQNPLHGLSKNFEDSCTPEQVQRARTIYTPQCHCTFCDENLESIKFCNELFVFHHVASKNHWEKMNFKAPKSEIEFWENWAESIATNTVAENNPRVPMLDRNEPNGVLVPKKKLNEYLSKWEAILEIGIDDSLITREETVYWRCTYCSGFQSTVTLINKLDALKHIVTPGHQENMGHRTTEADLEYWKSWITEIQQKNLEEEKKELEKYKKLFGDTMDKSKNSPRVPLLDGFNARDDLYPTDEYKLLYHKMREHISLLQPGELTDKKLECTCYHCPGELKMSNYREVMDHVFDGIHCQNIKFLGVEEDFVFFEKPLMALIKDRILKYSPKKPRPIQKRPMVNYKLEFCRLPLFDFHYFKEKSGRFCTGPTNRQIDFLQRMTIKEGGESKKCFERPTKCQFCQIDMSDFSTQDVVKHAFSIKHLVIFELNADIMLMEEFDWWMEKLKLEGFSVPHEGPFLAKELYLGGLKWIRSSVNTPVFKELSQEEQLLISNLDESKIEEHREVLLRLFGGCVYCDSWILHPMETIAHFLSEQHFEKVRKFHPVKQFDVDDVMRFVKMCQLA